MTYVRLLAAAGLLASVLVTPLPAVAAEPNPPQSGENGDCLAFNLLWLKFADRIITVDGGTGYLAEQSHGAQIYIDFYDAEGRFLGDNSNFPHRTPNNATHGAICVGAHGGGWPDLPAPHATWTYQDGF